jgi:hypothetical protein
MLKPIRSGDLIALVIAVLLYASPLSAQRRAAPKKPAASLPSAVSQAPDPIPTFDTLLSAESYRFYSEVRNVGQLVRSPALTDILDPLMKLAAPPKEFQTVLKWLNQHAEALAGSRMFAASWPAKPKLPNVLIAIEFASTEEAQKFDSELRRFMPTLMPAAEPTASPQTETPRSPSSAAPVAGPGERLPYHVKQAGTLILISDQPFMFRSLSPRGSKPLAEDQNFTQARNRFASESIFLYVDLKSIEKEERERQQKYEKDEQQRIDSEAANPTKPEFTAESVTPSEPPPTENLPPPDPDVVVQPAPETQLTTSSALSTTALPAASPEPEVINPAMLSLGSILFGGETKWPEAIGAAVTLEGDSYVVRALILNGSENKFSAIPFIPQFASGPPLLPASPGIFPSDTKFFATASLDYSQIYEGALKAIANAEELARKYRSGPASMDNRRSESPFAIYEKKLGIKIKEDLLPLLGNEFAVTLPDNLSNTLASPGPSPEGPKTSNDKKENTARPADPAPVIAIAVKDKEALRKLIPRIIETMAFKGANLFAQTEKRDGTEITSYANLISYAFVGDFLVLSPDPAATKHLVDSYLNNQTLSSDGHFRNSSRWQPRQVLGQVYVAPDLMQRYTSLLVAGGPANNKVTDFLNGLNPVIEPVTYALSNEGVGPLHELHVPKNLLLLMIAQTSRQANEPQPGTNEGDAKSALRTVLSAQAVFKETQGKGRYGTLDELVSAELLDRETMQRHSYRIVIAASGDKFEATAVPSEYGQTGRMSFFIDESGVLRGGDHGGGPATVSDDPVN